jgi:lysozyme
MIMPNKDAASPGFPPPTSQNLPTPPGPGARGGAMAALTALIGAAAVSIVVPETQHWEGKRTKAYLDIAGVPTICFGDTANVRMGQVASDAECDERLARQLLNHARPVLRCVPSLGAPMRVNQRAASIVLAYNIGTTAFCRSTVAARFNAGDWRGGCDAFLRWNKARVGGVLQPVRGLTNRRQAERAVCLRGLDEG